MLSSTALPIFISISLWHAAVAASTLAGSFDELSDDDLIARLQETSDEGVGFDSMAWAGGFLAIDEDPEFRGGIIGSPKPQVSPMMRELVRRGCEALPALIEHLPDARPTKLIVGKGFMGKWFSAEYDPRNPDRMPPGLLPVGDLPSRSAEKPFDTYTVKVGDLCFVAIGQIVNRSLQAVRYQPSLCLVVNSQTERPSLSAAVKSDWGGLTPQAHEESLIADATKRRWVFASRDAVKRLLFYYPKSGESLALKLLSRPLCDSSLAWNVSKKLLAAKSNKQAARLFANFRQEYGSTASLSVREMLTDILTRKDFSSQDQKRSAEKNRAADLLSLLFPGTDPNNLDVSAFAYCSEQADFIRSIASFQFYGVNEALLNIIPRVIPLELTNPSETFSQYQLVKACAERLANQIASKPELRAPLLKNLSAFLKSRAKDPDSRGSIFHKQLTQLKTKLSSE